MVDLSTLGFSSFFERQLADNTSADAIVARVAAEHRGGYDVWSSAGTFFAQLAGRLMQDLDEAAFPGVGDWVTLKSRPSPTETTIIESVLTRRTVFMRGAAGRESRGQVIAANVDFVFAVSGLDADYNPRRIERYVARIWASGAQPLVVLNKADICDDPASRIAEVEASCPAVPVYLTNARGQTGLDALGDIIRPGVTAAFVGSSGVGKSTLINALLGEERMTTGEVRTSDGRGCHITTHRQLLLLPNGGLVLDTPGMRELQLLDEEGIRTVFSDIDKLAADCRFRDCRHDNEPGCAVKRAVAAGRIPAERLEHYLKLAREARSFELRHNEHLRRKSEKIWGKLYDDAKLIRRLKRTE